MKNRRFGGRKARQGSFREPILKVLYKHGGEARRLVVLKEVEQLIRLQLTDFDKSDIASGSVRWEKSAEWEVHIMRREALLKPAFSTEAGMWSLTDKGRSLASQL
jgi:hypothetical protein